MLFIIHFPPKWPCDSIMRSGGLVCNSGVVTALVRHVNELQIALPRIHFADSNPDRETVCV